MSYVCKYLQFGSNEERVPGYEEDLILSNEPNVPIPTELFDSSIVINDMEDVEDAIWKLVFSYRAGEFYRRGETVIAHNNTEVLSWYRNGHGGHVHGLSISAFVVDKEGNGEFVQNGDFVDFSENSNNGNYINTDEIQNSSVTATVEQNLSGYGQIDSSLTGGSRILVTSITRAIFDKIFVYSGSGYSIIDNKVTVEKGNNCQAIAVYRKEKHNISIKLPIEVNDMYIYDGWSQIIPEIIKDIIERGDIYTYLNPKVISEFKPEVIKKITSSLDKRIDEISKIKSVVSGLTKKSK